MLDSAGPGDLVMHWVRVVDERGRAHMEARWSVLPDTHAPVKRPVHEPAHAHAA